MIYLERRLNTVAPVNDVIVEPDNYHRGAWRVQSYDAGVRCEIVLFTGSDAEEEARAYARRTYPLVAPTTGSGDPA